MDSMEWMKAGLHPNIDEMSAEFAGSPDRYGPMPFWWLSMGRLEHGRLTRQMEQMAAGGLRDVGLVNLAPAGALYGCQADQPLFMTDEWWAAISHILAEGKRYISLRQAMSSRRTWIPAFSRLMDRAA